MKRLIVLAFLLLVLGLSTTHIYSDISDRSLFSVSGFEKNQMAMREEYYRREIPYIYFKKIGKYYLTTARFRIFKVDQELSKIFDIERHPLIVGGAIIVAILI